MCTLTGRNHTPCRAVDQRVQGGVHESLTGRRLGHL